MSEKKTRKLICQITGKPLFASKDYYQKKIGKCESEEILHKTYVCREALSLAKKGYSINDIRETVEIYNDFAPTLTDADLKQFIGNNTSLRINNNNEPTVGVIKTDPAVKKFLKRVLNNE
tara:strand:- start:8992 stop:9351 length:360 start_codon:yes stop_codon:yes gene_type:complete